MNKMILALFIAVVHALPAYAASYDCKKAVTAVEKMICSDAELSKLDEKLVKVYAHALVVASDPDLLKSEQRAWLKKCRNVNSDTISLKEAYGVRIIELTAFKSSIFSNNTVSDSRLLGSWESFSTAFYETGIITIKSKSLRHESCNTYFALRSKNKNSYIYESVSNNSCYGIAHIALNFVKIIVNGADEITVRYYENETETSLIGEGTYKKIIE